MKRYLIVISCLLCGCTQQPVPSSKVTPGSTYYDIPYNDVYEFHLNDGTRCVVFSGNKRGGITCDWAKTGVE